MVGTPKTVVFIVPNTPGTGFDLEPEMIEEGVKAENGFRVTI